MKYCHMVRAFIWRRLRRLTTRRLVAGVLAVTVYASPAVAQSSTPPEADVPLVAILGAAAFGGLVGGIVGGAIAIRLWGTGDSSVDQRQSGPSSPQQRSTQPQHPPDSPQQAGQSPAQARGQGGGRQTGRGDRNRRDKPPR